MEWLLVPLGQLLGNLGAYYAGVKALGIIYHILFLLAVTSVILAFFWLASKAARVSLIILGVAVIVGGYYEFSRRVATPDKQLCPVCEERTPTPMGHTARIALRAGTWESYWFDRHLPADWKPYQLVVRVRIGKQDLYVIMNEGKIHAYSKTLNVRAVEPRFGQ